jgi:thiol-disulfide isomerase/thioredoxin
MLPFSNFDEALPYDAFLSRYGTAADRARWDASRARAVLTGEESALLGLFKRRTNVLVLAGAWCGDCAAQCPLFERFAEAAPAIQVRYLDRDAHPDAQRELQINAGNRVPVVVFFSEDGFEVARYGERPLSTYRRLVRSLVTGAPDPGPDPVAAAAADWLREFERVQWMLRLSPRLRKLNGD